MNKKITKLMAALALLLFMTPAMVGWGQTTVASFSRSGTSNTTTGGTFTTTFSAKSGYYQDNNGDCYMQILNTSAYWTTTPTSISFAAKIGGGTGNKDLTNPVYVSLLDQNGDVITSTQTSVTSHITNSTGDDYTISIPVTNNVFGVKLSHEKESGYNVRYYSFSLSYVAGGSTPTTYTITFDAGVGTFVGNTDFPNASNTVEAGTYTLPSATPATGYAFDGWTATGISTPITGSYTVSENVDFIAHYIENTTPSGELTLTFPLNSNPGDWPTTNSSTIENYTYALDGVNYTFALLNVKCTTSGYTMIYYVGALGLPAIEGYKLTKVVASNSGGCSTSTKVGISSSASQANYIAGGAAQTWSTTSSQYTYNLTSTDANTMYYLYVTNKNAQVTSLALTYEAVSADAPSITASDVNITYNATSGSIAYTIENEPTPVGTLTASTTANWLTLGTATSSAVPFTCTANDNVVSRSATVTLTYTYGDNVTVTKDIVVTQGVDATLGTANNPYTVAQARTFIDGLGGSTSTEKYVSGIISQIDSYNSNYSSITYWISDDGTTTNQLEVYSGKGINGANFNSINDVELTAEVVVKGNLKKYNGTYEFDYNNELVVYNGPQHDVEAPTFSPVAGTYAEAQTVTISCATANSTIYYTLDGTEPTSSSTQYTSPLAISSTTTVKAIAYVGSNVSNVAIANYYFCSAEDSYSVTEALAFAAYQYPANGIYVHGIVSTAPTSLSSGTLTYYISDDGTTTNQLEVYKGKDLNNEAFTAVDDIQVGDIVTVYGNVQVYNGTIEFGSGNYLVSFERPQPVLEEYDLTVSTLNDHINAIYVFDAEDESTPLIAEGLAGTVQVLEGTDIIVSPDVEEGYVLASLTVLDSEGTSVQPENHMNDGGYYSFTMPSGPVTITATAEVAPATVDYELYSGALVEGDYLIVYNGSAMNNIVSNDKLQYETVSATNNVITTGSAAIVWHIAPSGDYWTIYSADANAYAASTGAKNKAQMLADGTDDKALWSVSGTETYDFTNKQNTTNGVNATLRNNVNGGTNYGFACYATGTGGALSLYKKVVAPESHTLTINGYGDGNGDWYLIASPVTVDPSTAGMTTGEYDLYSFDQTGGTDDKEWRNYKQGAFNLEPGTGYLYAHKNGGNFTLTGTPYTGNGQVRLSKTGGGAWEGWNLVGNPFGEVAYIEDGRGFYTMQASGSKILVSTSNSIQTMEGVFVVAATDGETMTFTTTAPQTPVSKFVLNLNDGHNVIDRAIVRFDECRQLPKLQLFENSTKVYIPMDGQDYAVVRAEEMGEMPVNFKAEENGTYSLSLSSENVEFAYLHLIDNLTGNDVDLLQTPSYSFEAKTTDYANRFKLVFATGDNSNDNNFAYFCNGSFVINNEGNAMLQVMDVTGRMISSETINGCTNVNVNAATGVYMLRLVNGDNVKVQKVVVK